MVHLLIFFGLLDSKFIFFIDPSSLGLRIRNGHFFGALKLVLKKHYYNLLFGRVVFTSVVKSIPWLRNFALSVDN